MRTGPDRSSSGADFMATEAALLVTGRAPMSPGSWRNKHYLANFIYRHPEMIRNRPNIDLSAFVGGQKTAAANCGTSWHLNTDTTHASSDGPRGGAAPTCVCAEPIVYKPWRGPMPLRKMPIKSCGKLKPANMARIIAGLMPDESFMAVSNFHRKQATSSRPDSSFPLDGRTDVRRC